MVCAFIDEVEIWDTKSKATVTKHPDWAIYPKYGNSYTINASSSCCAAINNVNIHHDAVVNAPMGCDFFSQHMQPVDCYCKDHGVLVMY